MWLFSNNEDLVGVVTTKGSFGCSNHQLVLLNILSRMKKASGRAQTSIFRTDISSLKELIGGHGKQL